MRKIDFKVFDSFEELREDYEQSVRKMTPAQRLAIMEKLRREHSTDHKVVRKLEILDEKTASRK